MVNNALTPHLSIHIERAKPNKTKPTNIYEQLEGNNDFVRKKIFIEREKKVAPSNLQQIRKMTFQTRTAQITVMLLTTNETKCMTFFLNKS